MGTDRQYFWGRIDLGTDQQGTNQLGTDRLGAESTGYQNINMIKKTALLENKLSLCHKNLVALCSGA